MTLALYSFGVLCAIELTLWMTPLWKMRKIIAIMLIPALSVDGGLIAGAHFSAWALLLLAFTIYRVVNLLRVVEGRMDATYLAVVVRRTGMTLITLQGGVLALAWVNHHFAIKAMVWISALAGLQLLAAAVVVASTLRHLRTTRPTAVTESYADRDLPTLSVCIPARNESEDLEDCLRSLGSSTYPKLEILVLDDCSQNKRTPEIIREFAQDGVRFIAGEAPPLQWLAKNYAYQQLADAANGGLLLFCGADTRFSPDSLRNIVGTMLEKRKHMISLIPKNQRPAAATLSPLLVQPSRYAWELSLPRRLLHRPPVLSTCWVIQSQTLSAAGGFKAIKRSISPESYFARFAANNADGYSFLQSNAAIGLVSAKSYGEQRATAIRTRYPQTHRRPEIVAVLTLLESAILFAPFAGLLAAVLAGYWLLSAVYMVVVVLLVLFYARIMSLTYRRFILRGLWLLPFAVLYDVALLNYSMWQYEFREVIWKDRNVCIPVMHVTSQLPKT